MISDDELLSIAQYSNITDRDLGDWVTDFGYSKNELIEFARLIIERETNLNKSKIINHAKNLRNHGCNHEAAAVEELIDD